MPASRKTSSPRSTGTDHPGAGEAAEFPDPGEYLEEDGPRVVFREPYVAPSGRVIDLNAPNPLSTQAKLVKGDGDGE